MTELDPSALEATMTTEIKSNETRLRERAEKAEADLMRSAREAEMLRINHDRLKTKLAEAEALANDLQDAEDADRKRMYQTEAMVTRARALAQQWIDDMPANVSESAARVIFAEAGQRVLNVLDGS